MYVHQSFPKWKYHADHEPRLVSHAEAEAKLGPDWQDSPAHVKKAQPKAVERPAPIKPVAFPPEAQGAVHAVIRKAKV